MTHAHYRFRQAGFALCLIAVFATGGCAHFRNAELRAAQEQAPIEPAPTQRAVPIAPKTEPLPALAAPPPPAPTPVSAPAAAEPAARAPEPEVAAEASPAPAVPEANPVATAAPTPPPAIPAPTPLPDTRPTAPPPASSDAVIVFANTPGAQCGTCDTLKISVAPSGQVLIERGIWGAGNRNWRYKRSVAHVGPARAAAFAAGLSGDRPTGDRLLTGGGACAGVATATDGLVVEWIEAERHDVLTLKFGCPADRHGVVAERLRQAPDLLGLRELVWPDRGGQ